MITITAKTDGFRRAGIAHPAQATLYPDGAFTAAELDMLRAEPMLVVEVSEDKPAKKVGKNEDSKEVQEG